VILTFLCLQMIFKNSQNSQNFSTSNTNSKNDSIWMSKKGGKLLEMTKTVPTKVLSKKESILQELRSRFYKSYQPPFSFTTWNKWKNSDGLLCWFNYDCKWLDKELSCHPRLIEDKINVSWTKPSIFYFIFVWGHK